MGLIGGVKIVRFEVGKGRVVLLYSPSGTIIGDTNTARELSSS